MKETAVITGIGVVSALGTGREKFGSRLYTQARGVGPGTLEFDGESLQLTCARIEECNLTDFIEPRRHLNFKHMSRSGVMVCAAASLAVKDAGFTPGPEALERTGIVMGTAFGGVQSMLAFNAEVRAKGPTAVNPILFPDTVSNAPAGYAAIAFGFMGMNATLSTGFSSGLEALRVGAEQLISGELDAVVAGGFDELCPTVCQYWLGAGDLAEVVSENGGASVPFDSRRTGFCPGEAAVVLLMERGSAAARRQATVYGEVRGWGDFLSHPGNGTGSGNGAPKAHPGVYSRSETMRRALEDADAEPGDISGILASANGSIAGDREEAAAICGIFGRRPPVTAVKGFIGECMAAAGPAAVAAGLLALRQNRLPGNPGFVQGDPDNHLSISAGFTPIPDRALCLVNSFGPDGSGTSLVLGAAGRS